MKKTAFTIALILSTLAGCHKKIETGDSLNKKTIIKIKELGLLDDNEKIIRYYTNYQEDKAGNFFTDKRIAHYWLDEHDNLKTDISSAYYKDIAAIDTTFNVPGFDIPYMTITKHDSTTFRVFIDGTYDEENAFFIEAINMWKVNKDKIQ